MEKVLITGQAAGWVGRRFVILPQTTITSWRSIACGQARRILTVCAPSKLISSISGKLPEP